MAVIVSHGTALHGTGDANPQRTDVSALLSGGRGDVTAAELAELVRLARIGAAVETGGGLDTAAGLIATLAGYDGGAAVRVECGDAWPYRVSSVHIEGGKLLLDITGPMPEGE